MQKNTVTNGTSVVVAKQLPFSNNFVQKKFIRMERTRSGLDAIVARVVCTKNSDLAGHVYTVCYTLNGNLMWYLRNVAQKTVLYSALK